MRAMLAALMLLVTFSACAQVEKLNPITRSEVSITDPGLSPEEWRWLRERGTLRVGVWSEDVPPFGQREGIGDYGGINADVIGIITQNLNLKFSLLHYDNKQDALDALKRGEVDILPLVASDVPDTLVSTLPYNESLIAEVTRLDANPQNEAPHLGYVSSWLQPVLQHDYPHAQLEPFSSTRAALEALAFGHLDGFVGDIVTARYTLSQANLNQLLIHPQPQLPRQQSVFAALRQNDDWVNIIDKVLYSLPERSRIEIARRWNGGIPLSIGEQPLELTSLEQQWIADHPQIRVAVVGDSAPVAWFDSHNQLRGLTADVLTALALRTGLQFQVQRYDTQKQALDGIEQGKSDMIAGVSQQTAWQNNLLVTRSWLTTSWVVLGSQNQPIKRLSVVDEASPSLDWLQAQFPGSTVQQDDNWQAALNQLKAKKSDAVIMPMILASDRLHYTTDTSLRITQSLKYAPLRLVMSTSRNNYPLVSLLDKALLNIPPEDLHALTRGAYMSRFQATLTETPVPLTRYYAVLAGTLILLIMLWWQYRRQQRQQSVMRALKDAQQQAQEASQVKSAFLTTMSHEIRTPISAIIGMLELVLARANETSENQKDLRVAHTAAQSLLSLVGDILDVSRIESNRLVLHPERVAIRELISSVAILFDGLARQKNLQLQLELDSAIRGDVLADPIRIKQILANLLGNAIKFSERGAITLRASCLSAREGQMHLQLDIEDQGKGIDDATQQRLFRPFEQGNRDQQQGSGLGLYICRSLALMMEGEITLRSEPDKGTCVTVNIRLPVMAAEENPMSAMDSLLSPTPHHILLVDDNPVTALVIEQQLVHLGQQVTTCTSGAAALAAFGQDFDVVLTDCNMPVMDGYDLCEALLKRKPGMIVWGITADAQMATRDRALQAGMQACLFRPVTLNELTQALTTLPQRHHPLPEAKPDLLALLPEALKSPSLLPPFLQLQLQVIEETQHTLRTQPLAEHPDALHRLRGGLQMLNAPGLLALCQRHEQDASADNVATLLQTMEDLVIEIRLLLGTTYNEDVPTRR